MRGGADAGAYGIVVKLTRTLMLVPAGLYAAQSTVDIETAAKIYQEAAIREQVRASLGSMPAHIRQLFSADTAAKLSDEQLNAVTAAGGTSKH